MTSLNEDNQTQLDSESIQPLTNEISRSTHIRSKDVVPGQLIDLKNWYLTLPIGKPKDPDCIFSPNLERFVHPRFFYVNNKKDAVVFMAHCGGVTTKGARYARSELRECTNGGKDKAAWETDKGEHTMTYTASVEKLPLAKPSAIIGQIHATKKYFVLIKLRKNKLQVQHNDKIVGTLDDNFKVGKKFTIKINVKDNITNIYYDDMTRVKVRISAKASKCYFKVGSYLQSSTSTGDNADACAEVCLYDVKVEHK